MSLRDDATMDRAMAEATTRKTERTARRAGRSRQRREWAALVIIVRMYVSARWAQGRPPAIRSVSVRVLSGIAKAHTSKYIVIETSRWCASASWQLRIKFTCSSHSRIGAMRSAFASFRSVACLSAERHFCMRAAQQDGWPFIARGCSSHAQRGNCCCLLPLNLPHAQVYSDPLLLFDIV